MFDHAAGWRILIVFHGPATPWPNEVKIDFIPWQMASHWSLLLRSCCLHTYQGLETIEVFHFRRPAAGMLLLALGQRGLNIDGDRLVIGNAQH
jgi:hypothetical protein